MITAKKKKHTDRTKKYYISQKQLPGTEEQR